MTAVVVTRNQSAFELAPNGKRQSVIVSAPWTTKSVRWSEIEHGAAVTVSVNVAVRVTAVNPVPEPVAVTVITVVPGAIAVAVPSAAMVATAGDAEENEVLTTAPAADVTFALTRVVVPTAKLTPGDAEGASAVIAGGPAATVTDAIAVCVVVVKPLPEPVILTVMFAVPTPTALTSPDADTDATAGRSELYVVTRFTDCAARVTLGANCC